MVKSYGMVGQHRPKKRTTRKKKVGEHRLGNKPKYKGLTITD